MFKNHYQYELGYDVLHFNTNVTVIQNVPAALYTDPNEIAQHLTLKLTECEKLELPVMQPVEAVNEDLQ